MVARGLEPDVVTWNTVIKLLGDARRTDEALERFKDMVARGLEPDVVTFSTVIKIYSYAGSFAKVEHSLRLMSVRGIPPNNMTFYSIFGGLSHCKSALTVIKFLDLCASYEIVFDRDHGKKLGRWLNDDGVRKWFQSRRLDPNSLPAPPPKNGKGGKGHGKGNGMGHGKGNGKGHGKGKGNGMGGGRREPCHFFRNGSCHFGESCRFEHS